MIEGNAPRLWDPLSAWPKARIWLWAVLTVLTVITRSPDFADGLRPEKTEGIDFFQEWASARNAMNGLPVYADLRESARLYLGYTPAPGEKTLITRNAHPPTSVVVALPFSRLDYPQATLAWNLASLLALMISLWLIARAERLRCEWWVVFPVVTLALLCDPLQQQVNQGQLNLLLLLLLTLTWTAGRSGRSHWAGVFLGTCIRHQAFSGALLRLLRVAAPLAGGDNGCGDLHPGYRCDPCSSRARCLPELCLRGDP